MSLKQDYKVYLDKYGLVQPWKDRTSGNGLLYTAQYILACKVHNLLTFQEKESLKDLYNSCELLPGLMMRNPDNEFGQEGPDDYVGCALASHLMDNGELARRILRHGRTFLPKEVDLESEKPERLRLSKFVFSVLKMFRLNKYNWNNLDPERFTLSAWLGRQINLVALLQFAAGERPNILKRIYLAIAFLVSARDKKEHHDNWILHKCIMEVVKGKSFIIDLAIKYWEKKFKEHYKEGLGELLADYFGNEEHPSTVYLRNV